MKFGYCLFVSVSRKPVLCEKTMNFSAKIKYSFHKNVDRFIDPVKNLHSPAVLTNNR